MVGVSVGVGVSYGSFLFFRIFREEFFGVIIVIEIIVLFLNVSRRFL